MWVPGWLRSKPAISSVMSSARADPSMRPGAELLQQRAVHQLQPLDDGENLADAVRDLVRARTVLLIGDGLDGRRVRGDAEQAGTGLVMQLVGDLAPLLLLHGDQLPIQPAVLLPRHFERLGERVEAVGDDGKLLHLRRSQPRGVVTVLELEHAAGETARADRARGRAPHRGSRGSGHRARARRWRAKRNPAKLRRSRRPARRR